MSNHQVVELSAEYVLRCAEYYLAKRKQDIALKRERMIDKIEGRLKPHPWNLLKHFLGFKAERYTYSEAIDILKASRPHRYFSEWDSAGLTGAAVAARAEEAIVSCRAAIDHGTGRILISTRDVSIWAPMYEEASK